MATTGDKLVELSIIGTGTALEHLNNILGGDLSVHSYPQPTQVSTVNPVISVSIETPTIKLVTCGS